MQAEEAESEDKVHDRFRAPLRIRIFNPRNKSSKNGNDQGNQGDSLWTAIEQPAVSPDNKTEAFE